MDSGQDRVFSRDFSAAKIPASALDQFNVALSDIADQLMHLVIRLEGRIDEKRLAGAIRVSLNEAPVLGSRFREAAEPYWEPIAGLLLSDLLKVHETGDPEGKLREILVVPLDTEKGPQVRFDLIRSEADTLLITLHHAVADAHGVIVYAGLLARFYREGAGTGSSLRTPKGPADRSLDRYFSQFTTEELDAAAHRITPQTALWSLPYRSLACVKRDFVFLTLPPESLAAIRTFGKCRSATVNDVLLAAMFLTLWERAEPHHQGLLPILHSIDLRRHPSRENGAISPKPSFCEICNFSVAFDVVLPENSREKTLDELVPLVAEAMRKHKEMNSGLASALESVQTGKDGYPGFRKQVAAMKEVSLRDGGNNPFFANIGILPEEDLDFGQGSRIASAFFAGIVEFPPGIVVVASTFRNCLTFAMGYCSEGMSREDAEGLLDSIRHYLPPVT